MTNDLVFKNAQVVLRDEIVHGNILIRAGKIADISTGSVTVGEDLDGDYVLPGVVELHTDHVEYHMRPRPGVEWEPMSAVLAHDAQMAAAGATTVLDAVRLGSEPRARETTTAAARRLMGRSVARGKRGRSGPTMRRTFVAKYRLRTALMCSLNWSMNPMCCWCR